MAQVERVLNDHADAIGGGSTSAVALRRRVEGQALDMTAMKFDVGGMKVAMEAADEKANAVSENGGKLQEELKFVATTVEANVGLSLQGVWSFLEANNAGIMKL